MSDVDLTETIADQNALDHAIRTALLESAMFTDGTCRNAATIAAAAVMNLIGPDVADVFIAGVRYGVEKTQGSAA
jgi:hypothetical protein